MAEADQGGASGNGAAPAASPAGQTESVPQAQGAPVVTKEVSDFIASEIAKGMAAQRDAIFAEARRTFTEKRNKPKDELPAAAAPAPMDASEERRVLREFDRSLTQLGIANKISAPNWSRAEKLLLADRPEDVGAWVREYFEGYVQSATPAPQAQPSTASQPAQPQQNAAPAPRNPTPVSDRGAPPVPAAPLEEQKILSLSPQDREALRKQKGESWFVKKLLEETRNTVVRLR